MDYIETISAKPLPNYEVEVVFKNGEKGIFDVKPYLAIGKIFERLKNLSYFNGVKAYYGTISWYDEVDIHPREVYLEAKRI